MLYQRIKDDIKKFTFSKEKTKSTILRTLVADIKNQEIDLKRELTDIEIITIIEKVIRQINDTKKDAIKYNRADIIEKSELEVEFLTEYLPAQLKEDEVRSIIKEIVEINGFATKKDTGKLMKELVPKIKGKFDSKKAGEIVKEFLN